MEGFRIRSPNGFRKENRGDKTGDQQKRMLETKKQQCAHRRSFIDSEDEV